MEIHPRIDYQNFINDRNPDFCVYYLYPKDNTFGICREFNIDLKNHFILV